MTVAATAVSAGALTPATHAQSTDALIDKLVDKGYLTVREANQLKDETDKNFTKSYQVKSGMPEWVSSMKINGDFRGRYEGIWQDKSNRDLPLTGPTVPVTTANATGPYVKDEHRLRYRLRLGFTAIMSDQFEVGMRLASGNGAGGDADPLSTNTTLGNNGSKKAVNVDLAYARWTPWDWATAEVGKMNNQFWMTTMIFDHDYTPEGAQEKLTFDLGKKHRVSWASGQYVISENYNPTGYTAVGSPHNNDVYTYVNQLDWTAKWDPKLQTRLAGSFINWSHQQENGVAANNNNGNQSLNTYTPANRQFYYPYFNQVVGRLEATYMLDSFVLFDGPFPITPMVEYVKNLSAPEDGDAYNVGVTMGSAKKKGNWQVSYNFENIELNSVWSGWNESDFGVRGKGGSNVRGHTIKASYKVANPLMFNVAYFVTQNIKSTALADAPNAGTPALGINSGSQIAGREKQYRLQCDLVWSF